MDSEILKQIEALVAGRAMPEGLTVADVRERFLKGKGRLARKTRMHYEWAFDRMARFSPLFPRNAGEVNEFVGSLKDLGDVSVLQLFRCVRMICAYLAKTYGWVDASVSAERPKVEHKRRRYFTEDELKAIVNGCRDVSERTLILALLDSSARIGELAGLRLSGLGEDFFTVTGKTGQRRYRCDRRLVALMREIAVDGVVFPMKVGGARGRYIEPVRASGSDSLSGRVHDIMVRAGITGKKLGPHTLRHTAGSLVARKTMSALAVRAVLQHDSVKTSELYIHDVEEGIQQEVSPLEISGLQVGGAGSRQSALDGGAMLALPSPGGVVVIADLIEDLFPAIPDGVKVRPALSSEDLRLLRDGLISLMRSKGESGGGSRCVQLLRRMLRRV